MKSFIAWKGSQKSEKVCPLCNLEAKVKFYCEKEKVYVYKHSRLKYGITETKYCKANR